MADGFEIVSQRLTAELVGGHDLIDVWEVGARTQPEGVYFVFRVGKDEHTPEAIHARAASIANELHQLTAHQHVAEVAYVQTIGAQGQLVDHVDVHYQSLDGRHQGVTRVPLAGLSGETVCRHVDEAVQHLGSIASL